MSLRLLCSGRSSTYANSQCRCASPKEQDRHHRPGMHRAHVKRVEHVDSCTENASKYIHQSEPFVFGSKAQVVSAQRLIYHTVDVKSYVDRGKSTWA